VHRHHAAALGAAGAGAGERQLQAVLDASHQVAIIATDPEGEITLFNRGAEAMLGKPAAEVLGRVCTQLARDLPEFAARRERLSTEFGRPIDGFDVLALRARLYEHDEQEWTIYRENGRVTINLVASPMRGPDGEITGYVAIGRDITDSKAAEVALRESAYRVQGALHGSMDAIVMMVAIRDDAGVLVDMMFTDVNPRAEQMMGRPATALIGTRLREMYNTPDAAVPRQVRAGDHDRAAARGGVSAALRFARRDRVVAHAGGGARRRCGGHVARHLAAQARRGAPAAQRGAPEHGARGGPGRAVGLEPGEPGAVHQPALARRAWGSTRTRRCCRRR
jgi:PAS domain-containing protein